MVTTLNPNPNNLSRNALSIWLTLYLIAVINYPSQYPTSPTSSIEDY